MGPLTRSHLKTTRPPRQLNYADMLKRVEPLRNELQKLEDDAKDNQQKANEVEQMIRDLEASIARYKEEYAVLISEAQAIKADLAAVEAKVRLWLGVQLDATPEALLCAGLAQQERDASASAARAAVVSGTSSLTS